MEQGIAKLFNKFNVRMDLECKSNEGNWLTYGPVWGYLQVIEQVEKPFLIRAGLEIKHYGKFYWFFIRFVPELSLPAKLINGKKLYKIIDIECYQQGNTIQKLLIEEVDGN